MSVEPPVLILAGNIVRSPFIPVPAFGGTVALGDVTVRLKPPPGYTGDDLADGVIDLTAGIVADTGSTFHVDWVIPDDAPRGWARFHWESNLPSAKITWENRCYVTPAGIPDP